MTGARAAAGPTERQVAEAELVELMREIFHALYGVPRMHRELRRGGAGAVNERRVRGLMRRHGMAGRCIRRRGRTTIGGAAGYSMSDLVGGASNPAQAGRSVMPGHHLHRHRRGLALPG